MSIDIDYGGEPADWVCHGGAPARVADGMCSYESEDGELHVYDLLVAQAGGDGTMKLFSRWYGMASILAPDGMVPLHHSPDAWWGWRPMVYNLAMSGWRGLGSQTELGWRFGLMEVQYARHTGSDLTFPDADAKAEELLRGLLSPYQRVQLAATGEFTVRGGKTGDLYCIALGDGFFRIDERTGAKVDSFCLHPENWIPHDDVAVATMFALEDAALELDVLAHARRTPIRQPRPEHDELIAAGLERKLTR